MKIAVFATVVLLAGCATGRVSPAGKDTYIVSATRCGFCEPVQGYVTQIAAQYCTELHKNLLVRNISGNNVQPWAPGNATITFSCLNDSDPEYTRPNLRKDNGVTTIEAR